MMLVPHATHGIIFAQFNRRMISSKMSENRTITRKKGSLARREALEGYLCIAPWLIGFVVLTLGPMIFSFIISLSKWDMINAPHFVGLENYRTIFADDFRFRQSLKVTAEYAALSLPLGMIGALSVAMLLNMQVSILRDRSFVPKHIKPRQCVVIRLETSRKPDEAHIDI